MSLDPIRHQVVIAPDTMSAMVRRYPFARPSGASTAWFGDWFKESAECTR